MLAQKIRVQAPAPRVLYYLRLKVEGDGNGRILSAAEFAAAAHQCISTQLKQLLERQDYETICRVLNESEITDEGPMETVFDEVAERIDDERTLRPKDHAAFKATIEWIAATPPHAFHSRCLKAALKELHRLELVKMVVDSWKVDGDSRGYDERPLSPASAPAASTVLTSAAERVDDAVCL